MLIHLGDGRPMSEDNVAGKHRLERPALLLRIVPTAKRSNLADYVGPAGHLHGRRNAAPPSIRIDDEALRMSVRNWNCGTSSIARNFRCAERPARSPLYDVRQHAKPVERTLRIQVFMDEDDACKRDRGESAWWSQTGSNRRPPACKAGALPAELWPLTARY